MEMISITHSTDVFIFWAKEEEVEEDEPAGAREVVVAGAGGGAGDAGSHGDRPRQAGRVGGGAAAGVAHHP